MSASYSNDSLTRRTLSRGVPNEANGQRAKLLPWQLKCTNFNLVA